MAKRMSLSERRASDVRGVDVIFGGAPLSEEAQSQQENSQNLSSQELVPATSQAEFSSPAAEAKPALTKVTVYIRPEQVVAIESIQLVQRQRTGQKPDKSALLQEAVDLLIAKYQG